MDGWMDDRRWMDGWMGGWMIEDGWMDGWMGGWMIEDGWMDANQVYTLPPKQSSVIQKFGSGSIFCVFASVASIFIGKDGEYEKITIA